MAQTTINNLPLLPQQLIGEDFYTYVTTPTGGDFIAKLGEIVAQMQALNGCQCVQVAKLFITAAEVQALSTSPKPFGITVPAGYYVQPLALNMRATYGTTPFATSTVLGVGASGGSSVFFALDILGFTADTWVTIPVLDGIAGEQTLEAGSDFVAVVVGGVEPTAGDSDITLYMTYTLIEI